MLLLFRNLGFFRLIFFYFRSSLAEKCFGWGRKIIILMRLMDGLGNLLRSTWKFSTCCAKKQTKICRFKSLFMGKISFLLFSFGYITLLWSPLLFKTDQLIPLNYTKTFSLIAETFNFMALITLWMSSMELFFFCRAEFRSKKSWILRWFTAFDRRTHLEHEYELQFTT